VPFPIEAESRVTEALSAYIETMLNTPDVEEPVTLGSVRDKLRWSLDAQGVEADRKEFGGEQSLYAEVEALIEEYGEDAPAIEFTAVKASDLLSEVIEAILDDNEEDVGLTLEGVRAAMSEGWLDRLVGEGVLEADDEQRLLAEMDTLIERYGGETLAESLLRFE
jgi:hypothetical protein